MELAESGVQYRRGQGASLRCNKAGDLYTLRKTYPGRKRCVIILHLGHKLWQILTTPTYNSQFISLTITSFLGRSNPLSFMEIVLIITEQITGDTLNFIVLWFLLLPSCLHARSKWFPYQECDVPYLEHFLLTPLSPTSTHACPILLHVCTVPLLVWQSNSSTPGDCLTLPCYQSVPTCQSYSVF